MKLGIRFKATPKPDDHYPAAILSRGLVEVFNVETGEAVQGFFDLKVEYGVNEALKATMSFYVSAQMVSE